MNTQYRDLLSDRPHVVFPGPPERVNKKMERTREGFLICRDVALARTGSQFYLPGEVPLEPGPSGFITAEREEADVFDPEAIASFNGKPFTNTHPYTDVDPNNYKQHTVGTIMNPRRGEGDRAHCLLGDIIVYDAATIADIMSGKREVSAGYDAEYERIEPGRGRQKNIRGNHVSLVAEGRCGPTCAITDRKPQMTKHAPRKSFIDAFKAAFKAKDAGNDEEMDKQIALAAESLKAEPEGGEITSESKNNGDGKGGDSHHHVTVNIGGSEHRATDPVKDELPDPEDPDADEVGKGDKEMCTREDLVAAIAAAVAPLAARLDAMESMVEDVTDPSDSQTQDAVARAELIRPGFKLPTFDAKPGSRSHRDTLLNFKRAVLTDAFSTKDGRAVLSPLVGPGRPNFSSMTQDAVDVLFRAASERARDINNGNVVDITQKVAGYTIDNGVKKPVSIRDMNAINKNHYKRA